MVTNKPNYPPDKWYIEFDILDNGDANVQMDIEMAVPSHEDRPIDYLHFSLNEKDFKAFDKKTGKPLEVKVYRVNGIQRVEIKPAIELKRGQIYHYCLIYKIRNFVQNVSGNICRIQWAGEDGHWNILLS
jgi:hypothetical protein